jgi:hypothetical protein
MLCSSARSPETGHKQRPRTKRELLSLGEPPVVPRCRIYPCRIRRDPLSNTPLIPGVEVIPFSEQLWATPGNFSRGNGLFGRGGPIRKAASFRGRTGDGSLDSSSAATQRAGRDRRSHSDHGAEDEGLNAVDQFRAKTDFLDVDARVRIFRQAGTPTVAVGF